MSTLGRWRAARRVLAGNGGCFFDHDPKEGPMIRRTLTFLLVAGSIGGLAAGCGSSSKTPAPAGTSAAPASTSSAGTTGSGTTGATGATGATGGGGSVNAAAVTACKNT